MSRRGDLQEAMPQPVSGGGAESSTPTPPAYWKGLQAIADAPRCGHGQVRPHMFNHAIHTRNGETECDWDWCEGSPELAALLDALTNKGAL